MTTQKIKVYPTLKDYNALKPKELLTYDRRPFFMMLWDVLLEKNKIFWLFYKTSLFEPKWYRLSFFFFNLSYVFAMNALTFTDTLIRERSSIPESERVKYF